MSTGSETVVQVTRFLLTTSNYAIWKLPTAAKLEDLGIRLFVTGILKLEKDTPAEELARLSQLNVKAYSMIIQNLDPDNLALVTTTMPEIDQFDGHKLWNLLKNKYAGNDRVSRSTALDTFLDIEFKDVQSFCSAIRLANQKMVLANVLNDDEVKIMLMLRHLPRTQFQSFRDIVSMGFASEPFESIVKRLESYSISNNIKSDRLAQTSLHTRSDQGTSTRPVCDHCKTPGHGINNCWKKYPEKAPKTHQAHMTITDNANQLNSNQNDNEGGDFSYFRTADGVRHHIDEM
ncbi:hypothetical protein MJO28_009004 [Puccinia striiformis f. sp. tritici]|uniref:Retrotransposon Copia-like N-terminal domain-containing protein n=2 Tax=Puccinia striiformis TaxID=27350 RepID=A0A2S4UEQ8_9BASI|nr:hypothetical protein Pst134EB_033513 [Puccinia striiformis f. sp. tritici]KAI7950183.1 hypothetical protein MJO28_009004 [Puccinia striiformis f. sp. tritici]POV95805.1 hypothetical protein PSTT_16062 [Puccinia striiformis]